MRADVQTPLCCSDQYTYSQSAASLIQSHCFGLITLDHIQRWGEWSWHHVQQGKSLKHCTQLITLSK